MKRPNPGPRQPVPIVGVPSDPPIRADTQPPKVAKNPRARKQAAALNRREIAERTRAKRMLSECRLHLAGVLASSMDAIIHIDTARRIVFFNRAAEAMFRCPASKAIGQSIGRFIPECLSAAQAGHARGFLAAGTPSRGMVELNKRRGLRGDGSEFPIEATLSMDAVNGLSATLVVRDISRRVALETAVAAGQERIGFVSESAEVGYWDWDVATDHLEWSPRCKALCGIPEAEPMSYKRFLASVHPDDRERTYAAVHAALTGEDEYDIEYRTLWPDGRLRWLHAKGRATFAPDGRPLHMVGIILDITVRKDLEAALRASETRFLDMADVAPAILWVTEADGACSFLSRGWNEYTGQDQAAWQGHGWLDALHPDDAAAVVDQLGNTSGRPGPFQQECRILRVDGSNRWALAAGRPRFSSDGTFIGYIGSIIDIEALKRAEQFIREAALHDPLTDLPNRALILEYGRHQLAAAQRRHGGLALLFVVLNRFKTINARYGRDIGDSVLKEVAKRLSGCTRQEDVVGRLGGDAFVVLLPHLDANRNRAAIVAKHVLESVRQPMRIASHNVGVTPAIGIGCYPEHGIDFKTLVHAADLAMNQAKQSRQANYVFYSHNLEHHADQALELETRLRNALMHGGLVLHYQPVIDIRNGRLIAAEALVRLRGEDDEMIAPQRFIRLAESLGLIRELDEWVATTACRQHGEWLRQGLQPVLIAVNASALEFQHRDFPERLGRIISDAGIDPAHFLLELSEGALQANTSEVIDILQRIKSLGIQVALDEFGSGDIDLNRISDLPIDVLKIDPFFVKGIEHDETSLAVAKSIIALGHHLALDVVGEGIESPRALRHLRESGCSRGQGFLVSQPLPAEEFAHWCRRHVRAPRSFVSQG